MKNKYTEIGSFEGHTLEYYYYKLLLMCNFTRAESYMDIEVVNLLNQLYRDKGKVSDAQLKKFVALMQANISPSFDSLLWSFCTSNEQSSMLSGLAIG